MYYGAGLGFRYQLIENIVNSQQNQGQYYFQNQPQLQSVTGGQKVYVRCIESYVNTTVTASPLSSGNTIATPADIQNTYLVISVNGTEQLRRIPLGRMNPIIPNAGTYSPAVWEPLTFIDLWAIDWTKTYLQTAAAVSVTPMSFLFGVWYDYSIDYPQQ